MRIGLFTDSLERKSLNEVLAWLEDELPAVRDLEIGTGGYSPSPHCDLGALLADESERARWLDSLTTRGCRLSALNVSGNPLEIAGHDDDLRRTIELAPLVGVTRVVCMSGGLASLSGGGWSPGIEEEIASYWQSTVLPYWKDVAQLASSHPDLRLCFELEPGAAVYNVTTFERVAAVAPNLDVNLDPSHFFWQSIDPLAVIQRLGSRIGFAHGKDTVLDHERVALDGTVDRRSWRFATVGQGHGVDWWRTFIEALRAVGYDDLVSIEYEDPSRPPEQSVLEAANVLAAAMDTSTGG
jgi:sugar phosphate isomerase/epimerase